MTNAADTSLAGLRVLVVEDEYYLADDLCRALRARGAAIVGPVGRLSDALLLLASETIGMAVIDVNLAGQMVYPLADQLARRGVPFVFATGYDAAMLPPRHRNVPRWEKPLDVEDFARVLAGDAGTGSRHPF